MTVEDEPSRAAKAPAPARSRSGAVVPIGGAEDKEEAEEILRRVVALAGDGRAEILVVPVAAEDPKAAGARYVKVFEKLGVASVDVLSVGQRSESNELAAVEQIERATGIFITGGDQARLVSLFAGTKAMECLRERSAAGVVVAGTSAGASILASHMLLGGMGPGGNSSDAAARKGMVELVAGFGLLQDVIIDQHFSERGRIGRLLSSYAANPGLLGIGLDEDTAVVITPDGILEVLGSGMVTIVDGRNVESDYFEREAGEVLTVVQSLLHVLGPGRRFDLEKRRTLAWEAST